MIHQLLKNMQRLKSKTKNLKELKFKEIFIGTKNKIWYI
jgi:hypothetical protein